MTKNNKYLLRHKEYVVAEFEIDFHNTSEDDYFVRNFQVINEERLPFGLKQKDNEIYLQQMHDWLKHRGLSESRSDLLVIKQKVKANNTIELMMGSYGLNLSDQYWMHKASETLNWKDVNFFDNKFREVINEEHLNANYNNGEVIICPDFTVEGAMRKWWAINNSDNSRILIKESLKEIKQEPYNEKIASDILKLFDINHIEYQQGKYSKSDKILIIDKEDRKGAPISICKCEINGNCELIPAAIVLNSQPKENKSILNYDHYINICKQNGIVDIKKRIDEMIAIDFILGNSDRHIRNFGIIRNADSLQYERIMPIFDNGNTLYVNVNSDEMNNVRDVYCKWHYRTHEGNKTNRDMLNFIDYPDWYNSVKAKQIPEIIYNNLFLVKGLTKERLDVIIKLTQNNIKDFENTLSKIKKNQFKGFTKQSVLNDNNKHDLIPIADLKPSKLFTPQQVELLNCKKIIDLDHKLSDPQYIKAYNDLVYKDLNERFHVSTVIDKQGMDNMISNIKNNPRDALSQQLKTLAESMMNETPPNYNLEPKLKNFLGQNNNDFNPYYNEHVKNYFMEVVRENAYQQYSKETGASEISPRKEYQNIQKQATNNIVQYMPQSETADYTKMLNKNFSKFMESALQDKGSGPFTSKPFVHYSIDVLLNTIDKEANALMILLDDAQKRKADTINHFPVGLIADQKSNWMNSGLGNVMCTLLHMGHHNNINKYEFSVPARDLKQDAIVDNKKEQSALPDISVYQQLLPAFDPQKAESIVPFMTTMFANYENAAFTKIPYLAPVLTPTMVSCMNQMMNKDSSIVVKMIHDAHAMAIELKIPQEYTKSVEKFSELYKEDNSHFNNAIHHMVDTFFDPQVKPNANTPLLGYLRYADSVMTSDQKFTKDSLFTAVKWIMEGKSSPNLRNDLINMYVKKIEGIDLTRPQLLDQTKTQNNGQTIK